MVSGDGTCCDGSGVVLEVELDELGPCSLSAMVSGQAGRWTRGVGSVHVEYQTGGTVAGRVRGSAHVPCGDTRLRSGQGTLGERRRWVSDEDDSLNNVMPIRRNIIPYHSHDTRSTWE